MPTPTYTPLANITLGTTAANVTFSSITPGVYKDLIIVFSGKCSAASIPRMRFNGDTTSSYSFVRATGNGSSTSSGSSTTTSAQLADGPIIDSNVSDHTIHIFDYNITDKHKTFLVRANHSQRGTEMSAQRWASTAEITSIQLYPSANSWSAGSTFALYGIAA